MNENKKELISKNASRAPLSIGLASRGLHVARQLAQQSCRIITNSIGMKLVLIPEGTFIMRRWYRECGIRNYEVAISRDYYFCVTQVTQVQYEVVMGANPSHFQGELVNGDSSTHPVENVSWDEAVKFCQLLSEIPEEKNSDAFIDCQRKRSGSTRVEQERKLIRNLVLLTTSNCLMNTLGLRATVETRLIQSEEKNQTPGAYMTCMAMFGSGAMTGIAMNCMMNTAKG